MFKKQYLNGHPVEQQRMIKKINEMTKKLNEAMNVSFEKSFKYSKKPE